MRVLVTGGAGFIGSTLVDRLLVDGCQVVALDNFDAFYAEPLKRANLARAMRHRAFELVEGDVRDRALVSALVNRVRPDAIAHLAAKAGIRPSLADPSAYVAVNVLGTTHLLEAACGLDPLPRFVFASSSSVYGDRGDAPFRESDPIDRPVSPYAATKAACELMAHTYHHLYGLPITALRFFTAYGPRNRPDLAIAKFTRLIFRGEPIPMYGDGSTRRDYTYVDDVVDGVVRALDRCRGSHLYNLGNSTPIDLASMIAVISAAAGKPAVIETMPEQPGDVRQTYADISRAELELGYSPRTAFADGVRKYVEWVKQ